MKLNSWKKISEELQMSVKDCQRIWMNLRNKYGREKKALPSGSGAPVTPQWEYFDSLSFLNKYIKPRNTHTTTEDVKTMTAPNQHAPPLQSPVFDSSSCSSAWSNSTMVESTLDCPTQDYNMQMSPHSMYEENIIIQMEETEDERVTVNSEKAQVADKEKNKKRKNLNGPEPSLQIIDAAKSITQHLQHLTGQKRQPKTSADTLGEYIASVLKEMTPEQQKHKRRRLLEVLEDDD
ncbi:unnamed protein product [Diabrotica balteata]|uniref:MADF domain-containing protein n=1 Tax=Diabrotica balteata TaxID=107213 RepID=A0A9N9SMV5_DIABA|nr:unnamed protein product [Diabrotica balteata]